MNPYTRGTALAPGGYEMAITIFDIPEHQIFAHVKDCYGPWLCQMLGYVKNRQPVLSQSHPGQAQHLHLDFGLEPSRG